MYLALRCSSDDHVVHACMSMCETLTRVRVLHTPMAHTSRKGSAGGTRLLGCSDPDPRAAVAVNNTF